MLRVSLEDMIMFLEREIYESNKIYGDRYDYLVAIRKLLESEKVRREKGEGA